MIVIDGRWSNLAKNPPDVTDFFILQYVTRVFLNVAIRIWGIKEARETISHFHYFSLLFSPI